MNLTKALKEKKKLIKKADEAYKRFSEFNSIETESTPAYNAETAFGEWVTLTNQLVELKTKIQKANNGIMDKIFRLGELKNMVHRLRSVDVTEGKIRARYVDTTTERTAWMTLLSRDNQIQDWENQIETLQEEIESYNALTKI